MPVTFENQEKGEEVIFLIRPHFITLVPAIFLTVIFALAPIFLGSILGIFNLEISFLTDSQGFLIIIFWYLLVFAYAFYKFIFWYFNVYVLTNERIVDFDFRGILNKAIAYATLNHIEDVSPKTVGFFGTFFNFGDVLIQTAAEKMEFEFHNVASPDVIAERILEEVRVEEEEKPGEVA